MGTKYKADEPINVNVTLPEEKSEDSRKKKIDFRRERTDLWRRPRNNMINFYDMGQIRVDDEWVDLSYTLETGYSVGLSGSPGSYTPVWSFDSMVLADWEAYIDHLLGLYEESGWKSSFRKIPYEDGELYGTSVYNGGSIPIGDPASYLLPSNPKWTPDGYQPEDANLAMRFHALAMMFDTYDTTNYKVTDSPTYSSPEVSIDVSGGADVFLIPMLGFAIATREGGVDTAFIRQTLFSFWNPIPRRIYLDTGVLSDLNVIPPEYLDTTGGYSDRVNKEFRDIVVTYMKTIAATLNYVQRGTNASGGASFGFEDLSTYPYDNVAHDMVSEGWSQGANIITSWSVAFSKRFRGAGMLRAIIRTNDGTRYIWNKTNQTEADAEVVGFNVNPFIDS